MKHTYLKLATQHYLVDANDHYEVKYLKPQQLAYYLSAGEVYISTTGQRLGSFEDETKVPVEVMAHLASTKEWKHVKTQETLTRQDLETMLMIHNEELVLFPVRKVGFDVFHAEVNGIGTYYRQIGGVLEEIGEGEIAYRYAHLQDICLFLTLANDFNGKMIQCCKGYWKDVPQIELEQGVVELYELQVNQIKRSAQLIPRRLTHILSDLQFLTQANRLIKL